MNHYNVMNSEPHSPWLLAILRFDSAAITDQWKYAKALITYLDKLNISTNYYSINH